MRTSFAVASTRRSISALLHAAGRRFQREGQILAYAQMRIERVLLEDEAHVASRRRQVGGVDAADGDPTSIRTLEPGDQAQRRGLAGTGWAEQHDELPLPDGQVEIGDGDVAAEVLGDVR